MKVRAIHHNARMSPRKVRLVGRLLRGLPVDQAQNQLTHMPGKAAQLIGQVLRSAVANATNNFELDAGNLKVAEVAVDEGIVFKRFRPVARGMAHPIKKRTSHIAVIVEEMQASPAPKKRRRRTDIQTFTAEELATQRLKEDHHDHDEHIHRPGKKEDRSTIQPEEPRTVEKQKDVEESEAFQKTKMQQQGGDRKKAFRRKSI